MFSTAEELDQKKSKIVKERKLKLTKDRHKNDKYGDPNLAAKEGLKTIRKRRDDPLFINDDDDQPIDLKRIRSLNDLQKENYYD